MHTLKYFAGLIIVIVLGGCAAQTPGQQRSRSGAPVASTHTNNILRYAIGASSGLRGAFDSLYSMDVHDGFVGGLIHESLLDTDDELRYSEGMASYEYDRKTNTITLRLEREVYWHDGTPLTLDDLVFAYEVISHPDYDGIRSVNQFLNVVGAEEYHIGQADTIAGLELSENGKELKIRLHKLLPTTLMGGGFWAVPAPRHWLGHIPVAELASHPRTRGQTLGTGPFKLVSAVPGEAVQLRRFEKYWQGEPKLFGIDIEVMNPELIPLAMETGRFDIAPFSAQQLADFPNPQNFSYMPNRDSAGAFGYLGFRFSTNCTKPNNKNTQRHIENPELRRALAHAVDYTKLGKKLYNGLRYPATSILPPLHEALQDHALEGFGYSPRLSEKILDEAGFIDINGDGIREAPDGSPLWLVWATMSGEGSDVYVAYKLQAWRDIGLDVRLFQGRTHEFNTFYNYLGEDSTEIDMFDAGWVMGYDPNPRRLWGEDSPQNYTRYTSARFRKLMDDLEQDQMWDEVIRKQQYQKWQQAFHEEIPAIPTLWRREVSAVGTRVLGYSEDVQWHLVELKTNA